MRYSKLTAEHCAAAAETEAACLDTAWSEGQIREALNNEAYLYMIALEMDRLCGIVSVLLSSENAFLVNIAVGEAYRRRGVARELLRRAEEEAVKRGCGSVTLEVASKNANAIALYESAGYFKIGTRRGLYTDDDGVVMEKII